MVIEILGSRIYTLDEFNILGKHKHLHSFLDNRVHLKIDTQALQYTSICYNDLWNNILEWIEKNLEGKVIIQKDLSKTLILIYFEQYADLSMFTNRWQGKNE